MGPGEREFFAFTAMAVAGAGIGLAYDVGRVGALLWRRRPWLTGILDVVPVALAGVVAGAVWLRVTWGERRGYLLLSVLAGAALYRFLASPVMFGFLLRAALAARGAAVEAWRLGEGAAGAARRSLASAGRRWRDLVRRLARFL